MFGEKEILGHFNLTVDNKRRVIIPKSTQVQKGEAIAVLFDGEYYEIKSSMKVAETIERIKKEIDNTRDIKKLFELRNYLFEESSKVLKVSLVDAQGRILLPEEIKETKIQAVGGVDSLIFKKTL